MYRVCVCEYIVGGARGWGVTVTSYEYIEICVQFVEGLGYAIEVEG